MVLHARAFLSQYLLSDKLEQQRLLSFETVCYRRVMHVPWTVKRQNEDILEEVGGRQYVTQL